MHTLHLTDNLRARVNGDFSGDVILIQYDVHGERTMNIPFEALEELVAEKYRRYLVTQIEGATPPNILTGWWLR